MTAKNNNNNYNNNNNNNSNNNNNDDVIMIKVIRNTEAEGPAVNSTNEKVIFKNCAPLTSCITEINYTQVEYDEDIDIVDSLCII